MARQGFFHHAVHHLLWSSFWYSFYFEHKHICHLSVEFVIWVGIVVGTDLSFIANNLPVFPIIVPLLKKQTTKHSNQPQHVESFQEWIWYFSFIAIYKKANQLTFSCYQSILDSMKRKEFSLINNDGIIKINPLGLEEFSVFHGKI